MCAPKPSSDVTSSRRLSRRSATPPACPFYTLVSPQRDMFGHMWDAPPGSDLLACVLSTLLPQRPQPRPGPHEHSPPKGQGAEVVAPLGGVPGGRGRKLIGLRVNVCGQDPVSSFQPGEEQGVGATPLPSGLSLTILEGTNCPSLRSGTAICL